MKRLLLLLPLLLIAGCGKYGSQIEARAECRLWGTFDEKYPMDLSNPRARVCLYDKDVILGVDLPEENIKDLASRYEMPKNGKIVKSFQY